MKNKKIMKFVNFTFVVFFSLLFSAAIANAAPAKPVLKNDPMNGQILPFYEVWLRWNDNSDEAYYTMTVRDISTGDSGPLVYYDQYVAKNSTYFIIPLSALDRDHTYRWCLNAIDANGNRSYADAHTFRIETETADTHIFTGGYQSAANLEFFVYAKTAGYDTVLRNAVTSWNGISSNVHLTPTGYPTDGVYELGIFESPCTSTNITKLGYAKLMTGGSNGVEISSPSQTWDYAEIQTYRDNVIFVFNSSVADNYYISNYEDYLLANAMHEVGHALSLAHTSCQSKPPALVPICHPYNNSSTVVPLTMNSGFELGYSQNVVDRDHLRIKWGA